MTSTPHPNQAEIDADIANLRHIFGEYTQERILRNAANSRISRNGTIEEVTDRLIRFEIRKNHGPLAAVWNVDQDDDFTRKASVSETTIDEATSGENEDDSDNTPNATPQRTTLIDQTPVNIDHRIVHTTSPLYTGAIPRTQTTTSVTAQQTSNTENRLSSSTPLPRVASGLTEEQLRLLQNFPFPAAISGDNRSPRGSNQQTSRVAQPYGEGNIRRTESNMTPPQRQVRIEDPLGLELRHREYSLADARRYVEQQQLSSRVLLEGEDGIRQNSFPNYPMSTLNQPYAPYYYPPVAVPPFYPYPYPQSTQPQCSRNFEDYRHDPRLRIEEEPRSQAPSQPRIAERAYEERTSRQPHIEDPSRTYPPPWTPWPYPEGSTYGAPMYPPRDNCYERETRTCNILRQWKVTFSGEPGEDVEEFLEKLYDCRDCMRLREQDILCMIPAILTGPARYWARPSYRLWRTLRDFEDALRIQYRIPNLNARLDNEIRTRTQAPEENIASYLSCLRFLMDKVNPPMSLEAQLDRAFNNLHPSYIDSIQRHQFRTFYDLQVLGQQVEICRERKKAYKPPPITGEVLFPKVSPKTQKKPKATAVNAVEEETSPSNVAAVTSPQASPSTNTPSNKGKGQPSKQSGKKSNTNQQKQETKTSPPTPQTSKSENDPPTNNQTPKIKMEDVVCWCCDEKGHWAKKCPKRQGILCYKCKKPGVITPKCPKCNPQQEN